MEEVEVVASGRSRGAAIGEAGGETGDGEALVVVVSPATTATGEGGAEEGELPGEGERGGGTGRGDEAEDDDEREDEEEEADEEEGDARAGEPGEEDDEDEDGADTGDTGGER